MLKIDRIISISSEDQRWPAENLLKGIGKNTKWKCKTKGEKNASIVVQLEKASIIKSIDVGNENSAFIEILVGKSCLPDDSFKVLLAASSLMTLKEAKDLSNSNGVRFFKEVNFCKPELSEKWDRIKIVCSQPFNQQVQFGLSFIKFHGETGKPVLSDPSTSTKLIENKVTSLGKFFLKEEKEDDIAIGSIFARRKELQDLPKTSAMAIRAADAQLLMKDEATSNDASPARLNRVPLSSLITPNSARKPEPAKRNKPNNDLTKGPEVKKAKKAVGTNDIISPASQNPTSSNIKKTPNKPSTPVQRKKYKPFSEFLRGVIFTISGFQNPLRGDIRSKALEMGARYKPDWDDTCTHLVCAFANTPKFNQVRGHGKIVKKDWIEVCYSRRIRVPWRRYALDSADAKRAESEDELFEGDESLNNVAASSSGLSTTQPDSIPGSSLFGDLPKLNPRKKGFKMDQSEPGSSQRKRDVDLPGTSSIQPPASKSRRKVKKLYSDTQLKESLENTDEEELFSSGSGDDYINSESDAEESSDSEPEQLSDSDIPRSSKLGPPKKVLPRKPPRKQSKDPMAPKTHGISPIKNNKVPTPVKKKKQEMNNHSKNNNTSNNSHETIYLDLDLEIVAKDSVQDVADTDSDQNWINETEEDSSLNLPYLPEQFDDLSFYIADDFSEEVTAKLKRYITAHKGCIQENCSQDTEYVIADKRSTASMLKEDYPQIVCVNPEWVWRCHDENKLMPTSNFEL